MDSMRRRSMLARGGGECGARAANRRKVRDCDHASAAF